MVCTSPRRGNARCRPQHPVASGRQWRLTSHTLVTRGHADVTYVLHKSSHSESQGSPSRLPTTRDLLVNPTPLVRTIPMLASWLPLNPRRFRRLHLHVASTSIDLP